MDSEDENNNKYYCNNAVVASSEGWHGDYSDGQRMMSERKMDWIKKTRMDFVPYSIVNGHSNKVFY